MEAEKKQGQKHGRSGGRGGDKPFRKREPKEFEEQVLEIARVTRVTKGGKRMRFRAAVVIGDKKGRVGFSTASGVDVQKAVSKAVNRAKKTVFHVTMYKKTIPHAILMKYVGARVLLKPAPEGTGIKAGSAMRVVLELSGISNVVGKQLGSASKISNALATIAALKALRRKIEKTKVVKEEKVEKVEEQKEESQLAS